jgi:hypothetical protein
MKKVYLFAAALFGSLLIASPAHATENVLPVATKCSSQSGWYVNPDEGDLLPTAQADGFLFEGKDLVHHQVSTPLALADVHGGTFVASMPGKVVFKMETTNPYSTIVQNVDGKFWSSRLALDAPGGQNNPVSTVTDMIGSATKTGNPKYTDDTKIVTFGVGYWDESGSTVVHSMKFHGVNYDLTCAPPSKPVVTPTTKKQPCEAYLYYGTKQNLCDRFPGVDRDDVNCTQVGYKVKLIDAKNDPWGLDGSGDNIGTVGVGCESKPNKPVPSSSSPTRSTTSSSAPTTPPVGNSINQPGLPVTGPSIAWAISGGAILVSIGAFLVFLVSRRRNQFEA